MRYGPAVTGTLGGAAALAGITAGVLYVASSRPGPATDQATPLAFQNDPASRKLFTPHFAIDYSRVPTQGDQCAQSQDQLAITYAIAGNTIKPFSERNVAVVANGIPDIAEYTGVFMEMAWHEYCRVQNYVDPVPKGQKYAVYLEKMGRSQYEWLPLLGGLKIQYGAFRASQPGESDPQARFAGDCFHEFFHAVQHKMLPPFPIDNAAQTIGGAMSPAWLYEGTARWMEGVMCTKYLGYAGPGNNASVGVATDCKSWFGHPHEEIFRRQQGYRTALLWSYLQCQGEAQGKNLVREFLSEWSMQSDVKTMQRLGMLLDLMKSKAEKVTGRGFPDLFRDWASRNYYFVARGVQTDHCAALGLSRDLVSYVLRQSVEDPGTYGPGVAAWEQLRIECYGVLYFEVSDSWSGGITITVEDDGGYNGFYFDVYPGPGGLVERMPKPVGCLRRKGESLTIPAAQARGAVIVATRFHTPLIPGGDTFKLRLSRDDDRPTGKAALRIVDFTHRVENLPEGPSGHFLLLRVENTGGQPAWVRTFANEKHVNVDPRLVARRRADPSFSGYYHLGLDWRLKGEEKWTLAPGGWTPSPKQPTDDFLASKARVNGGEIRTFIQHALPSQMRSYSFRAFLLDPAGGRIDERDLAPTPRVTPTTRR